MTLRSHVDCGQAATIVGKSSSHLAQTGTNTFRLRPRTRKPLADEIVSDLANAWKRGVSASIRGPLRAKASWHVADVEDYQVVSTSQYANAEQDRGLENDPHPVNSGSF
jgi:hypothetical protein